MSRALRLAVAAWLTGALASATVVAAPLRDYPRPMPAVTVSLHSPSPSTALPAVVPTPAPTPDPTTAHRLVGVASWYCLPGRSACTAGYRSGGAYAAAGPALRRALGDWRGRTVRINGVPVRLIDWCECPHGRLIDLYGSVFRELAPLRDGLVAVEVTW